MTIPHSPRILTREESLFLFHHVFLPPKLPQSDDYEPEHEQLLLEHVIGALRDFSRLSANKSADTLDAITTMTLRLKSICGLHGDATENELFDAFGSLDEKGGFLPVHIREQNAGILFSRYKDAVHVETFELSPRNEPVITTMGRLIRTFPGPAIAMDLDTFNEPGLQKTLAETLARMSHQSVPGTKPIVTKAKQTHDEDRDTTHPKMVTEFLMAALHPRCSGIDTLQIQKKTREEVMWHDSRSPWRRSALWLFIRVSLQLVFRRLSGEEWTNRLYKQFMVYFMGSLLQASLKTMSSEEIYLMNAKIARRLLKLELPEEPGWFPSIQRILSQATHTVENRWTDIMDKNQCNHDMLSLADLDFNLDAHCAFPKLDQYIEGFRNRESSRSTAIAFQPQPQLLKYPSSNLPTSPDSSGSDNQAYNLAAFEEWVALHLDAWMEHHEREQLTCRQLGRLITDYYHAASLLYKSNPEASSVMFLTLLELWIACDKSAILAHEMLSEYDPCVPVDCFQPLLLPFKSQMLRLAQGEAYLRQRQTAVQSRGPGIFRDFGKPTCFSVRYFDKSEEHRHLYERIKEHADRERAQKMSELQEKQKRYRHLKDLERKTECQYNEVIVDHQFGFRESRHSHSCARCSYKTQAESIKIGIHEWPLSANHLKAKSTVFELKLVEPFQSWRDTTLFFLLDVLGIEYTTQQRPRAEHRLFKYRGLSAFATPVGQKQRIGLLSQNKPHERTHRKEKPIVHVTESDICLNNGLDFQYFDNTVGCFLADVKTSLKTTTLCTYRLPKQSSSLQQFLFRPPKAPNGLSPNTVIASQFAAPTHMPLEEYRALAQLPLGLEIQWQNILLELSAPSVDFKKPETEIFFCQAINQAGPSQLGTFQRQGHAVVEDPVFAATLLERIQEAGERIRENWEMTHGLSSLISLVLRVFSLSSSKHIQNLCVHHLKVFRQTALSWIIIIREKVSKATDDTQRTCLSLKNAHVALVCAETFNAEDLKPMFSAPSDLAIFVQCCMIIWNERTSLSLDTTPLSQILYHRWEVLSYRCHSLLAEEVIHQQNPGLNQAIQESWAAYRAESQWSKASDEAGYWLMTHFNPGLAEEVMAVHYNLLTGEFLVDGLPLARLPSDYQCHKTYRRLFGTSHLEVMPSSSPGMQFSCQKEHMGHVVHLGKQRERGSSDFNLSVKAMSGTAIWEFVPSRLFAGFFPDAFVEDCVHWYAVNEDQVEFRPASNPWLSSSQSWVLRRNSPKEEWYLEKQGSYLVNMKSHTANLMSNIFEPIEKVSKLHCIFGKDSESLTIELPRLRLEFSLQSQCSAVQSRQYPGMSVNSNQLLRCLTGLHNKLLLTNHNTEDQVVLIPEGHLWWTKANDHVDVKIEWQLDTRLHAYTVDDQLGWLVDDGSLQSKLFLAYLHALTSFCLADPLTKKTGTEQALSILRSASIRSFDQLQQGHIHLLGRIASITPERKYYPANERVMQEVCWRSGLGSLSQHNGFFEEVEKIFDQDRRTSFFYGGNQKSYPLPHMQRDLLKRDNIRNSSFRVTGYGAEAHTSGHDQLYKGLDSSRASPGACRVFSLCKMLYNEVPYIQRHPTEQLTAHLWNFLSKPDAIHGPEAHFDLAKIGYGAEWVMNWSDFVAVNWCRIHGLVTSRDHRLDKFKLMIWLSTMAFSETTDMVVLETIASLRVIPELTSISPPNCLKFKPSAGFAMDTVKTRALVGNTHRELPQTPEGLLEPTAHETFKFFNLRRKNALDINRKKVCAQILLHLESQWPTRSPSMPFSETDPKIDEYIDVQEFMTRVRKAFRAWYDNKELRQYVNDLAALIFSQDVPSKEQLQIPFVR
ncbi:uncharacterized protein N7482_004277 [Penicillium canariense]|uniref:ubiquitinyl hydrolase 1 n=1 Tax=Penicillium canariense TaxID=189055 RepID=A0A9W9LQD5_9EURO|nr:uncharacterized protein N7482_004277 [Penicillium canariense]KAJ5168683.1 hypothetical protein N7482_004277 [Penicillium canariense]